jgi:hypothetical protein
MGKQVCEWLIQPLNSHTNEVFAREFPEEDLIRDTLCQDGKKRNLYRFPANLIGFICGSQRSLEIKFSIFCRQGSKGQIRKMTNTIKLWRKKFKKIPKQKAI